MNYTKGEWKVFEADHFIQVHTGKSDITFSWSAENIANAHLIVTSVNACASVNPDNPMAVAESIKYMYEALKQAQEETGDWRGVIDLALTKAEIK